MIIVQRQTDRHFVELQADRHFVELQADEEGILIEELPSIDP